MQQFAAATPASFVSAVPVRMSKNKFMHTRRSALRQLMHLALPTAVLAGKVRAGTLKCPASLRGAAPAHLPHARQPLPLQLTPRPPQPAPGHHPFTRPCNCS
jgi:hypothetical protein